MLSEQEILRYIGKQPKHAAGFKQMIHDLGLKGKARRDLQALLKEMTRRRKLVPIGKERWSLPTTASTQNLVVGRLHTHRDGYGFVTPDPDSLPVRAQGKLQGDIFIPPPEIGNAMHGDRVLVELGSIRHDGKAEGRIVRVTEREQETVVGVFHYGHRHNFVRPIDEKVAKEIVIPPDMEYPSEEDDDTQLSADDRDRRTPSFPRKARKHTPHRVLGEEVKQADWDDLENVVVEVEIVQWPSASQNPRGRVIEILGYEDDFGVDVEIVIRKHHIPHTFPAEVLEEAQDISPVIPAREISRRADYRNLPIVTIDGETARDFDDAVLVRRLETGNYQLHVHIADVSHYVEDGSAIDEEARKRGTSVYFPDRAVPMLPLELSTDICSLRPQVDRLVTSCVMELDPRGEIVGYELTEGVIRSSERMTYTDVNAILEGDEHLRRRYAPLIENFELMHELAQVLNRKRARRGSIDFDMPEPVIEFDQWGMMKGVSRSERNWAHRLIEEFMLAANETVASHLERRVASIYRIHEKPDPKKIYEFENIAASFGYSLGVGALPVKRVQMRADKRARHGAGRNAPAIELPQEVHVTPRMYQKLVQKISGKPEERILSYLMLRSLKQARYSEINEGHFALAAPSYTHFTSPIRRYPDLIVHRILKTVLQQRAEEVESEQLTHVPEASPWSKRHEKAGKADRRIQHGPISEEELHDIAESSSRAERAADEAERELLEWKKLKFMQDRVGEDFSGLIVSVTKFGFFVELEELFIEGLVPLASLDDDHYTFHENTRQIIGGRTRKTYSIGDKVRVLVDRIDRMQRKIQFAVLQEKAPQPPKRPKKRG
jgi:ribonuclease R